MDFTKDSTSPYRSPSKDDQQANKVNGKHFSDLVSARIAMKAAESRELPPADQFRRLPHEWGDACHLAQESGPEGLDAWLKAERVRLIRENKLARFEELAKALETARTEDPPKSEGQQAEAEEGPPPFRLNPIGARALNRAVYRMRWHVEKILVAGQPGVVGAPKKSMKTSTMVDLAVSLAAGLDFLGAFRVPVPVKVLLLSGESGDYVIQETVRRVCRSKGIDVEELEGRFFVDFQLPQLGIREHLEELARVIRELEIEVVIIDPLYLCLLGGTPGRRLDASNLFDMGPLLLAIARTCLDCGATPLLVHHFKKTGTDPYELPELEELAYAGIQEFARQWILLKRRERYEPGSGEHHLWLSVGGSAGHSGEWALDVSEGAMDIDFQGREWGVSIKLASEARGETAERRQAAKLESEAEKARLKDEAKQRQLQANVEAALDALRRHGKPATKTEWQRDVLGWNADRFGPVFARLREDGRIRPAKILVSNRGGQREVEAWEPVPRPDGAPQWFEHREDR